MFDYASNYVPTAVREVLESDTTGQLIFAQAVVAHAALLGHAPVKAKPGEITANADRLNDRLNILAEAHTGTRLAWWRDQVFESAKTWQAQAAAQ